MLPSQIAFKAADYMAEHGNCKYTLEDEAGRVCLEGAVRMAAYGHTSSVAGALFQGHAPMRAMVSVWFGELWEHLGFMIRQEYPDLHAGPVSFNDDLAEGPEHVIQMLKRAGHELEEQGR